MLADEGRSTAHSGALRPDLHLPSEWLSALVRFIGDMLPAWRDDPARPVETSETRLTARLCARLNSLCHHTPGWDFLQFRQEEPDESVGGRAIDLVSAPAGQILWISGRAYNEYQSLIPIECKRLPTPVDPKRDSREYLYSDKSSTGGVQRFKAGAHGAAHPRAAMIGYVQDKDVAHWREQIDAWIDDLIAAPVTGWSHGDRLALASHDTVQRVATLASKHERMGELAPILIDHLWIEM